MMTSLSSSSSCLKNHRIIIFLILLSSHSSRLAATSSSSPSIGVSMNPSAPGVPSIDLIVSAIDYAGIHHVLLQNPDVKTLSSFMYTNISLLISLPLFLFSTTNSSRWISTHILPFHPRIHVSTISIGDISSSTPSSLLLLQLRNFRSACIDLGLPNIPISTVHSDPYHHLIPPPPSSARFRQDLRPLLEFLNSTGSPFLVDLYPFHLYRTNPSAIPLRYFLFLGNDDDCSLLNDEITGLRYRNVFDEMVDAIITSLEKTGYGQLPIVVTGTGWPTAGTHSATPNYSFLYNAGLVEHLSSGLGTPMRREGVKAVYLHSLFDDDVTSTRSRHDVAEWDSHWGIWFANLTHKYGIDFSSSASASSSRQGTGGLVWATVRWSCFLLLFFFIQLRQ